MIRPPLAPPSRPTDVGLPGLRLAPRSLESMMAVNQSKVSDHWTLEHLFDAIRDARVRLRPYLKALRLPASEEHSDSAITPLIPARQGAQHWFKCETQTVTRAYKVRGAMVAMLRAYDKGRRAFVTVSTGNHALGVLKAAELIQEKSPTPLVATIVVPENIASLKRDKLLHTMEHLRERSPLQAELCMQGQSFEDARTVARLRAQQGAHYVDPFGDYDVISGQGTIGLELIDQLRAYLTQQDASREERRPLSLVSPVGGGGLLLGIATALRYGVAEESFLRGQTLTITGLRLANMNSPYGDAIRVLQMSPTNQRLLMRLGVQLREIPDAAIQQGLARVRGDLGRLVEGAAGAAASPQVIDDLLRNGHRVVSILSGANVDEGAYGL